MLQALSLIVLLLSICLNPVLPTFQDYAAEVFIPYRASHLQHVARLDIFWDRYEPESLKADCRCKRGEKIRRCVESSSAVPGNWQAFLRVDENKSLLFSYLATRVAKIEMKGVI